MKIPCLLIVSLLFLTGFSQNPDIDLLKSINLGRDKSLDPAFRFITNSVTPASIVTPVAIYATGFFLKDTVLKHKSFYIAGTIVTAALVTTGLKYAVNRTRPFVTYPFLEKETTEGSPSFPSGHTSDAFATATSLSLAFPKWYVVVPLFAWASAVGYSRMHLGVHYPSDVLTGALIGSGSAWLCYYLNKKILKSTF